MSKACIHRHYVVRLILSFRHNNYIVIDGGINYFFSKTSYSFARLLHHRQKTHHSSFSLQLQLFEIFVEDIHDTLENTGLLELTCGHNMHLRPLVYSSVSFRVILNIYLFIY